MKIVGDSPWVFPSLSHGWKMTKSSKETLTQGGVCCCMKNESLLNQGAFQSEWIQLGHFDQPVPLRRYNHDPLL